MKNTLLSLKFETLGGSHIPERCSLGQMIRGGLVEKSQRYPTYKIKDYAGELIDIFNEGRARKCH